MTNVLAKIGAALFVAWGAIHVLGGVAILSALSESVAAGFATYRNSGQSYDGLAGAVLGYFAFLLVGIGLAAAAIGGAVNWRNSQSGLAINTAMIGFTEVGLVWFLVLPGYVSWSQASVGLVPFLLAAVLSGIACQAR